ncbi:MAG: DUF2937 family protein [Paracoccaceae bacterium]|nr:DUF2937 family protein [Paracoccaceae bacterium]
MVLRMLAVVGGLTGAAGLSQFPEFSQQYMQRLGGTVDELGRQVQRYERDAEKVGLSLPDLLTQLGAEGPLSATQSGNMRADIARLDALQTALSALEGAGPFTRAHLAARHSDREIAAQTLKAYKPALPVTFEGAVFAGSGYLGGWMAVWAVIAFLGGFWASVTGLFGRRTA